MRSPSSKRSRFLVVDNWLLLLWERVIGGLRVTSCDIANVRPITFKRLICQLVFVQCIQPVPLILLHVCCTFYNKVRTWVYESFTSSSHLPQHFTYLLVSTAWQTTQHGHPHTVINDKNEWRPTTQCKRGSPASFVTRLQEWTPEHPVTLYNTQNAHESQWLINTLNGRTSRGP